MAGVLAAAYYCKIQVCCKPVHESSVFLELLIFKVLSQYSFEAQFLPLNLVYCKLIIGVDIQGPDMTTVSETMLNIKKKIQ